MATNIQAGFKLLNDDLLDSRMRVSGKITDSANIYNEIFTVPLGPIDFQGEANEPDGSRPLYMIVGGNKTSGWVFKKQPVGNSVPDNIITDDDIAVNPATQSDRKLPGLVAGKIPAGFLPTSPTTFKTIIDVDEVDDTEISDLEATASNGEIWMVRTAGGADFVYNGVDGAAANYAITIKDRCWIVWDGTAERWEVIPPDDGDLIGDSFTVYLPITGSIGGFNHGDEVLATATKLSVIKRILQEIGPFEYINPLNNTYLNYHLDNISLAANYSTHRVLIGSLFETSAMTIYFSFDQPSASGKTPYGNIIQMSIYAQLNLGSANDNYFDSLQGDELYSATDSNNDGISDIANRSFNGEVDFPRPTQVTPNELYEDPPADKQIEYDGFRLNYNNNAILIQSVYFFRAPSPDEDGNGTVDPNPPGTLTLSKVLTIKATKAVFYKSGSGSAPNLAALQAMSTAEIMSGHETQFITSNTHTVSMLCDNKTWFLVAVPELVGIDKLQSKVVNSTGTIMEYPWDVSNYTFAHVKSMVLVTGGIAQSYKVYLLTTSVPYDSGINYTLQTVLKTYGDQGTAWWTAVNE